MRNKLSIVIDCNGFDKFLDLKKDNFNGYIKILNCENLHFISTVAIRQEIGHTSQDIKRNELLEVYNEVVRECVNNSTFPKHKNGTGGLGFPVSFFESRNNDIAQSTARNGKPNFVDSELYDICISKSCSLFTGDKQLKEAIKKTDENILIYSDVREILLLLTEL